jgi:hypothetical protein
MSSVSNRFYVEAIDDGSTLHGQLLSTKALTQAWTGSAAVPNWTDAANQPTVYVDLMSGTSKVTPDAGGKWYYNNVEIEWADASATAVSTDGRFQKVNNYPTSANPTAAIKIIANLASNSNVNTDSLTYTGSYTLGGSPIGFSVSTFIRITGVSSAGIFGFIEFVGSNIVTEKNQVVTMYARLFSADGNEITATASGSPFSTAWKMNNASIGAGGDVTVNGQTYHNAKQVSESQITDNSIIECDFSYITTIDGTSTTLTYTTFENVDDQTDLEQMYIQYNGGNDTSATLKRGGSITWDIWMGAQDDPTVDTSWTQFYVKLLNADGEIVHNNITGIPSEITDSSDAHYGWRPLTWDGSAAHITLTYDIVHDSSTFKKYLTGIVLAEK